MIDYLYQGEKKYKKALFIDRDGTIIVDTVMPHKPEDLKFFEDSFPALYEASKLDAYIIIITNQSGIALGKYSKEDMNRFHKLMLDRMLKEGIRINAILYCPHYDRKNFPLGYTGCECSKPMPGLLKEACELFEINVEDSVLIGDKHSDIGAGINAGCRTNILVTTGIYKKGSYMKEELAKVYQPTFVAKTLYDAIRIAKISFEDKEGGGTGNSVNL